MAQVDLGVGAIGGKDSMSGSFEDLDVPPTLVSFATGLGKVDRVTSPELKGAGHKRRGRGPRVRGRRHHARGGVPARRVRRRWRHLIGCRRPRWPSLRRATAARPRPCSRCAWATSWAWTWTPDLRRGLAVRARPTAASSWSCADEAELPQRDGRRRRWLVPWHDHRGLRARCRRRRRIDLAELQEAWEGSASSRSSRTALAAARSVREGHALSVAEKAHFYARCRPST